MSESKNRFQKLSQKISEHPIYAALAAFGGLIIVLIPLLADFLDIADKVRWPRTEAQQHIETLKDKQSVELDRINAAEALGKFGSEKKLGSNLEKAVSTLSDRLSYEKEESEVVRKNAAVALGNLGPEAKKAVPFLAKALGRDPDPDVRSALAEALGNIGQDVNLVGSTLRGTLFNDKSENVKKAAAAALGKIGPSAIHHLRDALQDPDSHVRLYAASVLLRVRGDEAKNDHLAAVSALQHIGHPAVPFLLPALSDDHQEVRDAGTSALTAIGLPAVSHLKNALAEKNDNARYRMHVAMALLAINEPDAREARIRAAEYLGALAPNAKEGISSLITVFDDSDEELRRSAARAVAKFGSLVVDKLVSILQRDNPVKRSTAALALSEIGPEAKPAIPLLIEHSEENALVRLGAPAVPGLIHALNNSDTRLFALRVLEKIGPEAKEALPQLERALYDNDKNVRFIAISALAHIGKEAVPQLQRALLISRTTFNDSTLRYVALNALGNLGPEAPDAFFSLINALEVETESGLIATIGLALPNFGTLALEPLISALFHEKGHVRATAAFALGIIGDKRAIDPLQKLLDREQDEEVRKKAKVAKEYLFYKSD